MLSRTAIYLGGAHVMFSFIHLSYSEPYHLILAKIFILEKLGKKNFKLRHRCIYAVLGSVPPYILLIAPIYPPYKQIRRKRRWYGESTKQESRVTPYCYTAFITAARYTSHGIVLNHLLGTLVAEVDTIR